jgi:hypothetical protein
VERFAVYPFAGDIESVAARWTDSLRLLVRGADAVGLPSASNMTWILYRSNLQIFVQQMLMLANSGPKLSQDGTVTNIPVHRAINEDGQQISQWTTTIDAIASFLSA